MRGQHAEHHDLVLDAERGEELGDVARVPVAEHVAQAAVFLGLQDRGELVGGAGHVADRRKRLVPGWAGELLFHLCERRANDVVVVDVRPDGLDGVEPYPVDQIEIDGRERRRVRADVVGVGAAAAMGDDQPGGAGVRLVGALPGLAEQARLIGARQRGGFADEHLRRLQLQHRGGDGVDDVAGEDDDRAHRMAEPLRHGGGGLEHLPLLRRGPASRVGGRRLHVRLEQPHRHDDDVAIAGRFQRGGHMIERVRVAHGREHAPRPRAQLCRRHVRVAQDVERRLRLARRFGLDGAPGGEQHQRDRHEQRGRGHGRSVASHQRRQRRAAQCHAGGGRGRAGPRGRGRES